MDFNQLDNVLGIVLRTILTRLDRADVVEVCVDNANFGQRVRFLDILKHSTEGGGITDVPIADLRNVEGDRNIQAHAHFEQNPYSGEYQLIRGTGKAAQLFTAERVDSVARRIKLVRLTLDYAEAFYSFVDTPVTPLEGDGN